MPLYPSQVHSGVYLRLITALESIPAGTTAKVDSTGLVNGQWCFTVRWNTHYRLLHRFGEIEQDKKPTHADTPSGLLMEDTLECFEASTAEEYLKQLEEAMKSRKKRGKKPGFQELVAQESKQLRLFQDF